MKLAIKKSGYKQALLSSLKEFGRLVIDSGKKIILQATWTYVGINIFYLVNTQ